MEVDGQELEVLDSGCEAAEMPAICCQAGTASAKIK